MLIGLGDKEHNPMSITIAILVHLKIGTISMNHITYLRFLIINDRRKFFNYSLIKFSFKGNYN